MLSAHLGNSFHILPPMAGTTGRFPDSENSIELINHLKTHKSAIAIFVDMLISNISLHLDAPSQLHHRHLGGHRQHRTIKNFSNDYIHPTWWSPWDDQNPHKYFLERLEILQSRRDASQVYHTWGSEVAHSVMRQNLALFPAENDIQDKTLLSILERECTAVLNENNTVFVYLHERITANQLERQQKHGLGPIAEEPSDAEPDIQPDACATATVTTSTQQNSAQNAHCEARQTPSSTYRWSEFDSDDEDLPDISDFLPVWVQPTAVLKIEQPTPILSVEAVSALEKEDTEFNGTVDLSKQPLAAGGDTPLRNNEEFGAFQPYHDNFGYFSARLASIIEEPEDEESEGDMESEITSDYDTSTNSSPPRTPVDLNEHLVPEPLAGTPPVQDPLSTSHTYNSRFGMLEIVHRRDTSKRNGKGSELDMSLDMDHVECWASCVRMIESLVAEPL